MESEERFTSSVRVPLPFSHGFWSTLTALGHDSGTSAGIQGLHTTAGLEAIQKDAWVTVDAGYGSQTEAAVKAVQADCSIQQDGSYGPDTLARLLDLGGDA
jgi:peptidoglycan hydrolase-like protein with peptidoglycan-binding domain